MGETERLYKIRRSLGAGRCVTRDYLLRHLEVSESTLKRDIAMLRDRLNAPIVWDRTRRGWYLDAGQAGTTRIEMPDLWFSPEEVQALLTMRQLLINLDATGLLGPEIEPLMRRLGRLLGKGIPRSSDVARRIRVLPIGARKVHLPHFQSAANALLGRRRARMTYRGRSRGVSTEREISPQRLVHYRDNWYLDAWCHWRDELRSFSVDAIEQLRVLEAPAVDVPDDTLDEALGAGYGIFAGRELRWAFLRFSAERARWVAGESWHPMQLGSYDAEGRWILKLPYTDPRELVMDILRHVPEVEVLGPEDLQEDVVQRMRQAVARMAEPSAELDE